MLPECCILYSLIHEGGVNGTIKMYGNMGNCNNNGNDIQAPCGPCIYTGAPGQADTDCDSITDDCDLCDGGNDTVDNDENGVPDCAEYPGLENLPAGWRCGNNNNKVLICHSGNTLCVSPNSLADHLSHGDYIGPCGNASCQQNLIGQPGGGQSMAGFQLFPNPTTNTVNLDWQSGISGTATIQAVSLNGRVLFSERVTIVKGYNSFSYDVGTLKDGLYFLKVTSEEETKVLRFVKSE